MSNVDPLLYDQILQLVVDQLNCGKDCLSPQTRLFQDLHCDGQDGEDLIEQLHRRFSVDLQQFVFDRHFGPEIGFNPLLWLFERIFKSDKLNARGQYKKIPITIKDLYDAAESGHFPHLADRPAE